MGAPAIAERVDPYAAAREEFELLEGRLRSEETSGMDHHELEELVAAQGREVLRKLLQAHLTERAARQPAGPVVAADGEERTHRRDGERQLETVLGGVTVSREGYGGRGKETLFPLDAELNLPAEKYSFGVRRRAAEAAARGSYDEAVKLLAETTGAKVPKRQLEELVVAAAGDFDVFRERRRVLRAKAAAKHAELVVLTFDGKGVPMRRDGLREATRKAAELRTHKLKTRLSKGEKRHSKRMAQVAAVYGIARFPRTPAEVIEEFERRQQAGPRRPKPEQKMLWASVQKESAEVIEEAFAEAAARDRGREREWVVLVDGNADQIRTAKAAARRLGAKVTLVLDVIHVIEYLWEAAHVFHKEGTRDAERWVTEKLLWLLCGEVGRVRSSMTRAATLRGLEEGERAAVDRCARYLESHANMVKYDEYLAKGYPIATGVIEGACRYVVKDRMERTGARWSLEGAEAVLRLRALWASGELEEYWRTHEREEKERNHLVKYSEATPPALAPVGERPRRDGAPHLRVVK